MGQRYLYEEKGEVVLGPMLEDEIEALEAEARGLGKKVTRQYVHSEYSSGTKLIINILDEQGVVYKQRIREKGDDWTSTL